MVVYIKPHFSVGRIDGAKVPREPTMACILPRDDMLTEPEARDEWRHRIATELVPRVITHPDKRDRQPWMRSMRDLRGTWGWGILLYPRSHFTAYDRFIDLVLEQLDGPLQIGWAKGAYACSGATLLDGFRVPTNMEVTYS